MNFLAHVSLSGNNEKIMVGNFIGDFVKGKNLSDRFDADVVRGIELHRAIDWFTDHHPVVTKSKEKLRAKYRHYAPVIVDIFYDHFLARNWERYHTVSLAHFAQRVYQIMVAYRSVLPEDVNYFLPYMVRDNWLVNYAKTEGIQRSLTGISRRTKFDSKMDESVEDLKLHYSEFEEEFLTFFPDLQKECETFLAS